MTLQIPKTPREGAFSFLRLLAISTQVRLRTRDQLRPLDL